MNQLKVTPAVLIFTLFAILYAIFWQPNLKLVVWKRGETRFVYGQIEQAVAKKPGELSLLVKLESGKIYIAIPQISFLAKCSAGNRIEARVKIYPLRPGFSHQGFYEYLLLRQGVIARAWLAGNFSCIGRAAKPPLRLRIFEQLRQKFGDTDQLSLILAINLGAGELLGDGIKELFRDLGLSHALVVSGFHVGLVYLSTFLLFDYLISRSVSILQFVPSEFIAVSLALLAASSFSYLCGLAMPCHRAVLFLLVTAFFKIVGSAASGLHRVLITFAMILFYSPSSFFDLSLLLSVAAVVGVLCGLRFQAVIKDFTGRFNKLVGAFAVNLFAWMFTLPLCLVFFGQVFPFSPVVNFILLPLITLFFSFIGVPGMLIGYSCIEHLFAMVLVLLGQFLAAIWGIHEFFGFEAKVLGFEQALILAAAVTALDFVILVILYRFKTKQTDDFQQLAPA